jgi:hypothetical protein
MVSLGTSALAFCWRWDIFPMGLVRQAWICSSRCLVALLTHGLVDEDGEGLGETFESVVEDCFEGIIWEFLFWVFGHHGTIYFVVKNEIALIEAEAHLRGQTGFCTPPLGRGTPAFGGGQS